MQNDPVSTYGRTKRWTAALAGASVSLVLLLLNLDGYWNELYGNDFAADLQNKNWIHGWPVAVMVRDSTYPTSGIYDNQEKTSFIGPHSFYSRWPIDDAPVAAFYGEQLILDIGLFLFLVWGTYYSVSRLHTSFGLQSLFFAVTMMAIFCGWLASTRNGRTLVDLLRTSTSPSIQGRCAVQACALAVVAIAATLAVHAAIAGASGLMQRYLHKRRFGP